MSFTNELNLFMDLRSSSPYWLLKNGIINTYPSLQQHEKCDVAIIGAGISGALVAWHLERAGINTILLDRRHVATGSTAASTALLQYEIDVPLQKLSQQIGEPNAVKSYRLCLNAIETIESICKTVEDESSFINRPSFQYASHKTHVADLKKEYELRSKNGFAVQWLEADEIRKKFGFEKAAGLLSEAGAEVDAYKMTHDVIRYCMKKYTTKVFDNTTVTKISATSKGFNLLTENGYNVKCNKVVIAAGYESQKYLEEQVEILNATYAIISEPLTKTDPWYKNALIWETAKPYLYLRTTNDNRIIIGGKDTDFTTAKARDLRIKQKTTALEKSFQSLFPAIKFSTDFSWAGTFAGTKDGLPYIGCSPGKPGIYFALGFGGNGITFSAIAGEIITDLIKGKKNNNASIFKFGR